MNLMKRIISAVILLALLCTVLSSCVIDIRDLSEDNKEPDQGGSLSGETSVPDDSNPETEAPEQLPIDIETTGGVVVVGVVKHDANGWYLEPEQSLNVDLEFFIDNPTVFDGLTRIELFDSTVDDVEKGIYLGKTVTIEGNFTIYRDFFDKLYLFPYTITLGKTIEQSYAAPDLVPPTSENLYDPSIPLPKYSYPMNYGGQYIYNAFMLSEETLQYMGNDFAFFYCDFVDAFLNYRSECPCPSKEYAEMLTTIIYYEFPLYNACAEPFEFFKHYDHEKGTVTIDYKYLPDQHMQLIDEFMESANTYLSKTAPGQSEFELAKNIYHELCTRVKYDDSALTDFQRKDSHYAYMAYSGVCVTFANVYNQLLTQVGIKATTARSEYTPTLGHVWTLATIDGKQYFFDPTFELSFNNGTAYRYFGQSYSERIADGIGEDGITAGRYHSYKVTEEDISPIPLQFN